MMELDPSLDLCSFKHIHPKKNSHSTLDKEPLSGEEEKDYIEEGGICITEGELVQAPPLKKTISTPFSLYFVVLPVAKLVSVKAPFGYILV
jgi:hypothetical protein